MFRATFHLIVIAMLSALCAFVGCKRHSPERLRIPAKSSFGQYLLPATITAPAKAQAPAVGQSAPVFAYGAPHVHAHHQTVRQALHQVTHRSSWRSNADVQALPNKAQRQIIGEAGLRLLVGQREPDDAHRDHAPRSQQPHPRSENTAHDDAAQNDVAQDDVQTQPAP